MKKLILIIVFITMSIGYMFSQVLNFKTTAFATNKYTSYGWTGWSKWESSNMLVTFDLDNDLVTIYSPSTQIYGIYQSLGNYYDSDGDYNMVFKFIDQDYDYGTMRLLQRTNGASEIYIEFANIKWVYRVIRM